MMRIVWRYMVRFPRFTRELLADNLNPKCTDCGAPASTVDMKYREWVCSTHATEGRA